MPHLQMAATGGSWRCDNSLLFFYCMLLIPKRCLALLRLSNTDRLYLGTIYPKQETYTGVFFCLDSEKGHLLLLATLQGFYEVRDQLWLHALPVATSDFYCILTQDRRVKSLALSPVSLDNAQTRVKIGCLKLIIEELGLTTLL